MIIPLSKWLGSPPFINHGLSSAIWKCKQPSYFRGGKLTMAINHVNPSHVMILQVFCCDSCAQTSSQEYGHPAQLTSHKEWSAKILGNFFGGNVDPQDPCMVYIYTYIWLFMVNVARYTIRGYYGTIPNG